jgi:hypothetical protein
MGRLGGGSPSRGSGFFLLREDRGERRRNQTEALPNRRFVKIGIGLFGEYLVFISNPKY